MTKSSIARETLRKAQFFLTHAEKADISERFDCECFLEAAIVFGRSVTFHIRKEYCNREGFSSWYPSCQDMMNDDPVFQFLNTQRNYILKEGPAKTLRFIKVSFSLPISWTVQGESLGQATVRIIAENHHEDTALADGLRFDDPDWSNRPAMELVQEYLDKLKAIVDDAEARFETYS